MIEINGDKADIIEALISITTKLLKYESPTHYSISDDEIISRINEEPGVYANEKERYASQIGS